MSSRKGGKKNPLRAYQDATEQDFTSSVEGNATAGIPSTSNEMVVPAAAGQQVSVQVPSSAPTFTADTADYYLTAQANAQAQEGLTDGERMGGIMGAVVDFADDITPDDMGGLLRGTSGPLSVIPGYKYTLGAMANAALSGGSAAMNALYWGSEQSDHAMAWFQSALPGGIPTLDVEWSSDPDNFGIQGQVTQLSAGQAWLSHNGQLVAQYANPLVQEFFDRIGLPPTAYEDFQRKLQYGVTRQQASEAGVGWLPFGLSPVPFFADDFDPLDPDQKKRAFEDSLAGRIGSGTPDFLWDIFGDPTVVGGKVTSVLRYGTRGGQFAGFANQSLRNTSSVVGFAKRIDDGLDNFVGNGGRKTAEFGHVRTLVDNEPSSLTDHVFVKGSNDPQAVMRLASMIEPGRYDDGASLVKALAGERSGWEYLREMRPDVYDELYRTVTGGADLLTPNPATGVMSAAQVDVGRGIVATAQRSVDELTGGTSPLDNLGEAAVAASDDIPAGQILDRGGARGGGFNPALASMADSWRLGKARGRWGNPQVTVTGALTNDAGENAAGWVSTMVQATSSSRPVMLLRWAGRGRPTGIVHLKGGDGATSNTEVHAWLSHSAINPSESTTLFDNYVKASTVEGRRNAVLAMERAHIRATAANNGITVEAAQLAYDSYTSLRNKKVWEVRKTAEEMGSKGGGTAFTVDENGKLVNVAGLYSELDEAFPMLDTLEFDRVVRANKDALQAVVNIGMARGTEVADFLNNAWKVSVLLRLGYTQRNIVEGTLRSAATIGMMALNPRVLARVPSSLRYRAYRRSALRKSEAQARAVDDGLSEMVEARQAIENWRKAARVDAMFKAREDIAATRANLSAAQRHARSSVWVRPVDNITAPDPTAPIRVKVDDEIDALVKQIDEAQKSFQVAETRNVLSPAAGRPAMAEAQKRVNSLTRKLETLNQRRARQVEAARVKSVKDYEAAVAKERARFAKDTAAAERDAAKRQVEVDRLQAKLDESLARYDEAKNFTDERLPELQEINARLASAAQSVDEATSRLRAVQAALERRKPKWNRIGEGGNVVGTTAQGEPIVFDGAFDGSDGAMARILSSADQTFQEVFNTGYVSRVQSLKNSTKWVELDPRFITSEADWVRYWDNYTVRLNQRYRQDLVIKQWLRRGDDEAGLVSDTRSWMMSEKGKNYTQTVRTREGKRLVDDKGHAIPERIDEYIGEMYRRYSDEIPKGSGLREALAEGTVTPAQARTFWGSKTPPRIPAGVEETARQRGLFGAAFDKYESFTGWAMKWLGSIPETHLLRHPFYEAVYRDEQLRMARLAADQGSDISRATVQAQINSSAHRVALKATRKTMYTIERQSNASNALRFLIPFFPAWENSLRFWARTVYQKPQIAGVASLMWNIPNSLGWVVDENGQKVEYSNFLDPNEKTYVVYPDAVLKALSTLNRDLGPINTADLIPTLNTMMPPVDENGNPLRVRTRQQSLNVVFPGGILDPGIGPNTTIPVSLFLRGKPELTEVLRNSLGENMFNSIVPLGSPNTSIANQILPTIVKRVSDRVLAGENENTAYLRLKDTMLQDEIIRLAMEDKRPSEEDMRRVLKRADDLWNWSINQAATAFTASSTYNSEFTVERGIWRSLLDDTSLPYSEKVKIFIRKVEVMHPGKGEDFLVLTRSTTESPFKVNATESAYNRLTLDEGRIEDIAEIYGREFVGMFTNIGDYTNPFSPSVYGELQTYVIDGKSAKQKMTPQELKDFDDTQEYWRRYFAIKDGLDAEAKKIGLPGVDSISGVKDILDGAKQDLVQQFPGAQRELDKGYDANRIDKTIKVSRMIVDTQDDYGPPNQTIEMLGRYLALRESVVDTLTILDGAGDDVGKTTLKEAAMEEIAALKAADIGFSDFYDRYLEDDDFREVN